MGEKHIDERAANTEEEEEEIEEEEERGRLIYSLIKLTEPGSAAHARLWRILVQTLRSGNGGCTRERGRGRERRNHLPPCFTLLTNDLLRQLKLSRSSLVVKGSS